MQRFSVTFGSDYPKCQRHPYWPDRVHHKGVLDLETNSLLEAIELITRHIGDAYCEIKPRDQIDWKYFPLGVLGRLTADELSWTGRLNSEGEWERFVGGRE